MQNFTKKNAKGEILTPVKVPDWARPTAIFENDLEVCFTRRACQQLESIFSEGRPSDALIQTTEHMARLLVEVLRGDPRSRYRRNKCSDRLYFVELDGLHVTTWFDEIHGEKTSIVAEILRIRTSK